MLINFLPPKDSLKNLIVNILYKDSEGKEIKNIKKELKLYSRTATYQGINKILNSLKEEEVVIKINSTWNLNKIWINNMASFSLNHI